MFCSLIYIILSLSLSLSLSAQIERSFDISEDAFCNQWLRGDGQCINRLDKVIFDANKQFVNDKRSTGENAVVMSRYLDWDKDTFEENMTMEGGNLPIGPAGSGSAEENFDGCPEIKSVDNIYPQLETPIIDDIGRFKHYVIDGLLNLMFIKHQQKTATFNKRFSRKQLLIELGENAAAFDVLNYLMETGVCTEEDYELSVTQDYLCPRYKITNYNRYRGLTSCALASKIVVSPLFVELALNPYYYQLSSTAITYTPVSKSFYRITVAGILKGFNIAEGIEKYWSLYIPRHGGENQNNIVHIKFTNRIAFAAITSFVYDLEVPDLPVVTEAPSIPDVPVVTEAPIIPDVPVVTEAPIIPDVPVVTEAPSIPDVPVVTEAPALQCGLYLREYVVNNIMRVPHDCFNDPILDTSFAYSDVNLKEIHIGYNSFKYAVQFKAESMPNLEVIDIERDSFFTKNYATIQIGLNGLPNFDVSHQSRFHVQDNAKLKTIILGQGAFAAYDDILVKENDKLESWIFGVASTSTAPFDQSWNFYYGGDLIIENLPNLNNLVFGNRAMENFLTGSLKSLPKLKSVKYGYHAWNGVINSVLTYTGLPLLESYTVNVALMNVNKVVLSDVNSIQQNGIHIIDSTTESSFAQLKQVIVGVNVATAMENALNSRKH